MLYFPRFCFKHAVQRVALRGENIQLSDLVKFPADCHDCVEFARSEEKRHARHNKETVQLDGGVGGGEDETG